VNGMDSRTLVSPVIPPHPSLTHGNWLAGFPLRSFLELGAYRNAAGSARGHARNVLAEWGLGQFTDAVVLLVSEMITNSVAATEKVAWGGTAAGPVVDARRPGGGRDRGGAAGGVGRRR
jgi:hypothetical protein